jgi:4-alpha-glucanotransferase
MGSTTKPLPSRRRSGILLHVTSLPSQFGIGDLGPQAHAWVETLARSKQSWWQVLPLGPTGYGDSPYQCFSAFAGNPNLISPELLIVDRLIQPLDLRGVAFPDDHVEYARVIEFKSRLTERAWANFRAADRGPLTLAFDDYCQREADWLDEFALFMAIKGAHGQKSWQEWPEPLRLHDFAAIRDAEHDLKDEIGLHKFRQFLFARQWELLRDHALQQGVRFIGDMPIFVALDSADVWANPDLFLLDANRRPTVQAGVPPDYFAATGQLWGNPLYNWETHRESGYRWWKARLQAALRQVDLLRLDHFRGFEAAWHVPAGATTAQNGRWVKGPGRELFDSLRQEPGSLPLIAEDLGVITREVDALRHDLGLPGMRIAQFAFGGATEERFLPHNYERHTVVYTGTHDNNTTAGWYQELTPAERAYFRRYAPDSGEGPAQELMRLAWASVAELAVTPLQDLLGLGADARMNMPGRPSGNWRWRATQAQIAGANWKRLAEMTETYQRASVSDASKMC